ncbi:unnamed protein product [Effrenium voratum]|nr:unnamed protein product [Effrenium voratum]
MYQEGQVVQAQVVQATVVGQPVGTVQHGVVQPQPYGMPSAYHGGLTTDQQGAQQGWMIYGIGWALCCCFGPVGPIFWFVVACMHYCKPAEVRKQLPMERQVACVSLTTALITTILEVVLIIAIIAWWSQIISSADAAGEGRVESFWLDL